MDDPTGKWKYWREFWNAAAAYAYEHGPRYENIQTDWVKIFKRKPDPAALLQWPQPPKWTRKD